MKKHIIVEALSKLDLTTFEIQVYMEIFDSFKPLTVSELASRFSVERRKVYNATDTLQSMLLVQKNTHKEFEPTNPSYILAQLQRKQNDIHSSTMAIETNLAYLQGLFENSHASGSVHVYTTKEQCMTLLDNLLTIDTDTHYVFGNVEVFIDMISAEYLELWRQKRIEKKICFKEIVYPNRYYDDLINVSHLDAILTQLKFIPPIKHAKLSVVYSISGEYIHMWNPHLYKVIAIQDATIAGLFKLQWNMLWQLL